MYGISKLKINASDLDAAEAIRSFHCYCGNVPPFYNFICLPLSSHSYYTPVLVWEIIVNLFPGII
jgi:hypothetical protein